MRHRNGTPNKNNAMVNTEGIPLAIEDDALAKRAQIKELKFWHWIGYSAWIFLLFLLVYFLDEKQPSVVPKNDYSTFSEERARSFLKKLTSSGPRTSGSQRMENETLDLMLDRLASLETLFSESKFNHFELEVQRPSGCFDWTSSTPFSLCYDNITNIIVRISSEVNSNRPALLLNCHLDSVPQAPGASDDAVGCVIYLDLLEVLARRNKSLKNDLIILFNAGEENYLQGSHGFITQHPWQKDVRAFLNLEGAGSGGREILFQATEKDSWILETYLKNTPYPHCNIIAQEIFESGIVPSVTDFKIYTEYGGLAGLDASFYRNGWVYHTEFDTENVINKGAIQHAGENMLSLVDAILESPKFGKKEASEETKLVFFDVVGVFTVSYRALIGTIINSAACLLVFGIVVFHLIEQRYRWNDLLLALLHHLLVLISMIFTGFALIGLVYILNITMFWYSTPILVFFVYIAPMLSAGFFVHSHFTLKRRGNQLHANAGYKALEAELAHYDTALILLALILLGMTSFGILSAYLMFILVLFSWLREPILFIYKKGDPTLDHTYRPICLPCNSIHIYLLFLASICELFCPSSWTFWKYAVSGTIHYAALFVDRKRVRSSNFVYLTRPRTLLFKVILVLYLFTFVLVLSTRFGNPYKWREDGMPRLRRLNAFHAKRTVYDFNQQIQSTSNGLFYQAFDFRGVSDLPKHKLLNGSPPKCSQTSDIFCQLPYYSLLIHIIPAEKTRWVSVESAPIIDKPLKLELIDRHTIEDSQFGQRLNLTFSLKGGTDKVQIHLAPLNNFKFKSFSFSRNYLERMNWYYVFWTYGYKEPEDRRFWILLERDKKHTSRDNLPALEIVVSTHQLHGRFQESDLIKQLREEVIKNRLSDWKWGITLSYGTSELISYSF